MLRRPTANGSAPAGFALLLTLLTLLLGGLALHRRRPPPSSLQPDTRTWKEVIRPTGPQPKSPLWLTVRLALLAKASVEA